MVCDQQVWREKDDFLVFRDHRARHFEFYAFDRHRRNAAHHSSVRPSLVDHPGNAKLDIREKTLMGEVHMDKFPDFIRNPVNSVPCHQKSDGAEGYVFDGADGNQIIFFQCSKSGLSKEHVHDFDEYFVVIQGEYTLGIEGRTIKLTAGQEYYIPKGTPHDGAFIAGTRTVNAFGGRRAERKSGGASQ